MQTSVIIAILGVIAYFIGNISPSIIMAKRAGLDIKRKEAAMPEPPMHFA